MLYARREIFDKLSIKIGRFFSRFRLTPNQWTIITIPLSLLTFYFLLKEELLFALVFFAATSFIDFIDGSVAKYTGKISKKGAYLDTIADRYVEFIILFGLFFVIYPHIIFSSKTWIIILLFGSVMTTYVKSSAFEKGLGEIKGGVLERAERLILIFLVILVSYFSRTYGMYLIILTAVLANVSALQRILKAIKS